MSDTAQLIQELDDVVQGIGILSYSSVSATFLLIYEIILTFPDEVRYIWLSPWSFVTILYLLIRYFTLTLLILDSYASINTNLSIPFCNIFVNFQIWSPVALVPAVDILIVLRVYALYKRSKSIGCFLIFLWLGETVIILVLTGLGFGPQKGASPNPLPGLLSNCTPTDPFNTHNLIIGGSVAIGFQAVYLGLALYKLAMQIKSIQRLTPLLEIFIRDGTLYCFNILAMYAISVFFAQHYGPGTPLEGLGGGWLVSIIAITGGKLVLNLRKSVHHNSSTNASNISEQSGSYELQFTTPMEPIQSTIIIDASQIRESTEMEPLPTSHTVALV